ncbi:hypothetical protein Gotur_003028, partial [Gossypium turneri]
MPRRRLRDLSIIQNPPNSEEINSEQQTAIGSSNVPNTADEPVEIQTKSGGRNKTRERMLLKDLYELNFVERVKVARNSLGQEKLKDKRTEYEAITSSDSSVNLDDIDNQIINKVLGPKSLQQYMPSENQAQAEVQRLRDQMAQIQASTVEQIAQLKAEASSREVE